MTTKITSEYINGEHVEFLSYERRNGEVYLAVEPLVKVFGFNGVGDMKRKLGDGAVKRFDEIEPTALCRTTRIPSQTEFASIAHIRHLLSEVLGIPKEAHSRLCHIIRRNFNTGNETSEGAFSDLKKLFDRLFNLLHNKDIYGVYEKFTMREFMMTVMELQLESQRSGNEWLIGYLKDVFTLLFEQGCLLYERYGEEIDRYSLQLLTIKLTMLINSKVEFDKGQKDNKSRLMCITQFKFPTTDPLYAFSFKQLTRPIQRSRVLTEEALDKRKLAVIDKMKKVPMTKALKMNYPTAASFERDNAQDRFQQHYLNLRAKALLFLEMATIDIMSRDGVIAKLDIAN